MKTMTNDVVATDGQSLFELVAKSLDQITQLPTDQLTQLADTRAGIESVFDKVEGEIQRRLEQGDFVNGFAMQPGRGTKVWNESEEEMVKIFRARKLKQDDYYPKKLASPAQILGSDKLNADQKKRIEEKYITVKAGKLKLTRVARTTEKSTEMMFADVNPKLVSHDELQKTVAQTPDNVVQSKSLFAEVPEATRKDDVSFF